MSKRARKTTPKRKARPKAGKLKTAVVRLSDESVRTSKRVSAKTLAGVLEGMLKQPAVNASVSGIVLKGGTVKASTGDPGDPWLRTVWRRSGPIRPGDKLIDPAQLVSKRPGPAG